jgi:CDP-paratose 2-epimerase
MTQHTNGRKTHPRRPVLLPSNRSAGHALITGGAGFVGSNLADRLLGMGRPVHIFDNCSRPGVEANLQWLRERHGSLLTVERGDVRDPDAVRRAVATADSVFHLAAQVAVTTSLTDPLTDFEVNTRGTLNVLEAVRGSARPTPAIVTSTNKVYGALDDIALSEQGKRWNPADVHVRQRGIGESHPLDFHSPYGCSKGAADQYVLDYARSFGLRTAVFRMSCIYGPRQFGTEDQGWVAHFLLSALEGRPVSLFGDGKQVRDILFVDDLVNALLLAETDMDHIAGRAFNVGGGVANTVSLLEMLDLIAELHGERPRATFSDWRTGDQRYYVSDTTRLRNATGWEPRVSVQQGIERLYHWLVESRASGPELAVAAAAGEFRAEPQP